MATNMKRKFYVCATPQPAKMELADFQGIAEDDWIEVKHVTEIGEDGVNTNILSLPEMDTEFADKGKGISDAGNQAVTVKHNGDDEGQELAEALALTSMYYATKQVYDDQKTTTGKGTTRYNRGIVTGPVYPNGSPEDFQVKTFTFGYVQRPYQVNAT